MTLIISASDPVSPSHHLCAQRRALLICGAMLTPRSISSAYSAATTRDHPRARPGWPAAGKRRPGTRVAVRFGQVLIPTG
jgi:hypothetical protein